MKKRKKLGAERLSEFFRQFSVLVESGLSIPETLEIMQQDDTDQFPLVKDMNPLYQSTFPINR